MQNQSKRTPRHRISSVLITSFFGFPYSVPLFHFPLPIVSHHIFNAQIYLCPVCRPITRRRVEIHEFTRGDRKCENKNTVQKVKTERFSLSNNFAFIEMRGSCDVQWDRKIQKWRGDENTKNLKFVHVHIDSLSSIYLARSFSSSEPQPISTEWSPPTSLKTHPHLRTSLVS